MPAVAVSVFDRERVLMRGVRGAVEHAWWDLASVTKILVTLPEALHWLELDQPLEQQWLRAKGKPVGAVVMGRSSIRRPALETRAPATSLLSFSQTIR